MNDIQRKVKMTTFLDNRTVLLQLDYRYMVFDDNGKFISNVTFSDIDFNVTESEKYKPGQIRSKPPTPSNTLKRIDSKKGSMFV